MDTHLASSQPDDRADRILRDPATYFANARERRYNEAVAELRQRNRHLRQANAGRLRRLLTRALRA
jgi:hypothetical protein